MLARDVFTCKYASVCGLQSHRGAGSTFPLCSDHRQTSQLPTYLLPSLPHVTPPSMPALPSALPLSLPSFNNPSPYLTSDLRIPPSQVVSNHPLVTSSNFFVLEDLLGWAEDERRPQRDSFRPRPEPRPTRSVSSPSDFQDKVLCLCPLWPLL